jgi:hypothetical protein
MEYQIKQYMEHQIKQVVHDRCEVLSQYLISENPNLELLGEMFATVCVDFYKKDIFEYAMDYFLDRENVATNSTDSLAAKVQTLSKVLERKFSLCIVEKIINTIIKYYKIK